MACPYEKSTKTPSAVLPSVVSVEFILYLSSAASGNAGEDGRCHMKKGLLLIMLLACVPAAYAAQSVPIILYHGINDDDVSEARFDEQMAALNKAGYTTVTEKDVSNFLDGKAGLPGKPILITFDDGRDDSFYHADPILKKYGFNAVMFVIAKHSTKPRVNYYMNKSEIRHMLDTGRWEAQRTAMRLTSASRLTTLGTSAPT